MILLFSYLFLDTVTDESVIHRYYARFDERFFQFCDKELSKINTFFFGMLYALKFQTLLSFFFSNKMLVRERSGSVVECLTRDPGAVGLSITSVTALCP